MASGQLIPPRPGRLIPRLPGVPVFNYHGLVGHAAPPTTRQERKYWVSNEQFRAQLELLRRQECRIALLEELLDLHAFSEHRQARAVLTFDDGRSSDYGVAFPLLFETGMRAVFFLNTATIGTPGFLSWHEIAEMQRAGMSFQSHGHDHVDMSRLSVQALGQQLRDSKRRLEDGLARSVDFLAPPYGRVGGHVVDIALEVGFRAVCSARCLPARPGAKMLTRVTVYQDTSLSEFRQLLEGSVFRYGARAVWAALLYVPRRALARVWPSYMGLQILEDR